MGTVQFFCNREYCITHHMILYVEVIKRTFHLLRICPSCFQLRVVRAFRSYLEDLEEKRSVYSSLRSHSLPRAAASLLTEDRRRSENHVNLLQDFSKSHSPNDTYSVSKNRLDVSYAKPRRHSCKYI